MTYCSNCGKEVSSGAKFCPNCAAPMALQQRGKADPIPSLPSRSGVFRSRGTGALVLVDFVVGIVVAALGILILAGGYAIGTIFVILGLLPVVVGYGLWKAKSWAWLLGLWAGIVDTVLGVLFINTVFGVLILPGIVGLLFYYFHRKELKLYLGKVRP